MASRMFDKRPPFRWSFIKRWSIRFMVYWDCRASKFGDNLASVRKQVTNFQKSIEIKGEWEWETNC